MKKRRNAFGLGVSPVNITVGTINNIIVPLLPPPVEQSLKYVGGLSNIPMVMKNPGFVPQIFPNSFSYVPNPVTNKNKKNKQLESKIHNLRGQKLSLDIMKLKLEILGMMNSENPPPPRVFPGSQNRIVQPVEKPVIRVKKKKKKKVKKRATVKKVRPTKIKPRRKIKRKRNVEKKKKKKKVRRRNMARVVFDTTDEEEDTMEPVKKKQKVEVVVSKPAPAVVVSRPAPAVKTRAEKEKAERLEKEELNYLKSKLLALDPRGLRSLKKDGTISGYHFRKLKPRSIIRDKKILDGWFSITNYAMMHYDWENYKKTMKNCDWGYAVETPYKNLFKNKDDAFTAYRPGRNVRYHGEKCDVVPLAFALVNEIYGLAIEISLIVGDLRMKYRTGVKGAGSALMAHLKEIYDKPIYAFVDDPEMTKEYYRKMGFAEIKNWEKSSKVPRDIKKYLVAAGGAPPIINLKGETVRYCGLWRWVPDWWMSDDED